MPDPSPTASMGVQPLILTGVVLGPRCAKLIAGLSETLLWVKKEKDINNCYLDKNKKGEVIQIMGS